MRSLAGALAVTFGLVGIDLAHALEQIVHVGTIDFRRGRSAAGRGRSVLKFAREMKTAQWDNLVFKVGDQMYRLDMSQAFPGMRLEEMIAAMDKSKTIQDLIRELDLKPV